MNLTVDDVIVVTGGTGMLGRKVVPLLRDRYPARVVALSSKDFDLVEQADVIRMFEVNTPTVVVHLAGYVGGIGVNRQYPADFFYRNTMMTTSVIHYASQHGVKKLVTAIGGCSYPAAATSPIHEDRMWDGYPQSENAPYSVAKKLALVQVEAYRRQYGLPAAVFIPGNVYGEHDNFSLAAAHVVPAMVRRFYEAMRNGDSQVPLWGSGSASRDFVYVGDVAAVVPFFLETVDSPDPVNISSGVGISIPRLGHDDQGDCGIRRRDHLGPDSAGGP